MPKYEVRTGKGKNDRGVVTYTLVILTDGEHFTEATLGHPDSLGYTATALLQSKNWLHEHKGGADQLVSDEDIVFLTEEVSRQAVKL